MKKTNALSRTALWLAVAAAVFSLWSWTSFLGVPSAVAALLLAYRARNAQRNALLPPEPVCVWARALGWIALAKCVYTLVRFFFSRALVAEFFPDSLQISGMPWLVRYGSRFFVTRLLLYFIGVR